MRGSEARQRWLMLGLMSLGMLALAFVLNMVPPILSLISDELHLSNTQGGLLMSLFALPGIVVGIPAGVVAQRYGQRRVGLVAFACMIGGTALFAGGNSFPLLVLGRMLAGVGAMTLMVILPQILAQWFAGRGVGTALGISFGAAALGMSGAFVALAWLGAQSGWRFTSWMVVLLSLLVAVLFVLAFRPAPVVSTLEKARAPGLRTTLGVGLLMWLVVMAWIMDNAVAFSVWTFTPAFLVSEGFTVEKAGFTASFTQLPYIFLAPVAGFLADKMRRKEVLIGVGLTGMMVAALLVPWGVGRIIPLLLFYGVFNSFVLTPIYALTPDLLPLEKLGVGYGLLSATSNVGAVVGPLFTGLAIDIISFTAGYLVMAAFAFLGVLFTVMVSWQRRRIAVPAAG